MIRDLYVVTCPFCDSKESISGVSSPFLSDHLSVYGKVQHNVTIVSCLRYTYVSTS